MTLAGRMLESDDPKHMSGWNFGPTPGNEVPVREVVELFLEEWGQGRWTHAADHNQSHESRILRLAIDKALWQLDWRPRWSVRDVLRQTARWYHRHFDDPGCMREFSLGQIAEYENADASAPLPLPAAGEIVPAGVRV